MREEGRDGAPGEDLGRGAVVQDAEREQLGDGDGARVQVQAVEEEARTDALDALGLHARDGAVDGGRLLGEGARDGKGASDVAGVAVPLGASIEHDELLAGQGLVVVGVVEGAAVGAGRGDDGVGLLGGAEAEAVAGEEGEDGVLAAGALEVGEDRFVGVTLKKKRGQQSPEMGWARRSRPVIRKQHSPAESGQSHSRS